MPNRAVYEAAHGTWSGGASPVPDDGERATSLCGILQSAASFFARNLLSVLSPFDLTYWLSHCTPPGERRGVAGSAIPPESPDQSEHGESISAR